MAKSGQNKPNNVMRAVGIASAIGADLVVCMVAGYFLGVLMQNTLGGNPVWLVVGMMLGFMVGVLGLIWLLRLYLGESR